MSLLHHVPAILPCFCSQRWQRVLSSCHHPKTGATKSTVHDPRCFQYRTVQKHLHKQEHTPCHSQIRFRPRVEKIV